MKRVLIATTATLSVGLAVAAQVAASASRAQLRGFTCQRALDPVGRSVSVTAVMRPVSGTMRLQLRFQLLSKAQSSHRFAPISAPGLGTWISPRSNRTLGQRSRDVWLERKPVVDLAAPATYRFRVYFRWLGGRARVLATAVRETPTCVQPELRPDLQVQSVEVREVPGKPMQNRYVARIVNRGATAAGPFEVLFAPAGKSHTVPRLAPHAATLVSFTGPVCATTSPQTIEADPTDQVGDYDRTNNVMTVACPG